MSNLIHLLQRICFLLEAIYQTLQEHSSHTPDMRTYHLPGKDDKELLGIQQVMGILGISRTSYYRFVKDGSLSPRILGNRHYYYLEDLQAQIRESRRRGRI